ncbi:hypothetical protein [Pajaroellobacter abortibovis]|nr:hypothetical protein [Pajaroellobacter abortibovis]
MNLSYREEGIASSGLMMVLAAESGLLSLSVSHCLLVLGGISLGCTALVAVHRIPSPQSFLSVSLGNIAFPLIALLFGWFPSLAWFVEKQLPLWPILSLWSGEFFFRASFLFSWLIVAIVLAQTIHKRRLEWGVLTRIRIAVGVSWLSFLLMFLCFQFFPQKREWFFYVTNSIGLALVAWVARSPYQSSLAPFARSAFTFFLITCMLATAGVLVGRVLFGGATVERMFLWAVTFALGWLISRSAGWVEQLLRPNRGCWVQTVSLTDAALRQPDFYETIARLLWILREPGGIDSTPAFWTFAPPRIFTIDIAGYLVERPSEVPSFVLREVRQEPYGILRSAALRKGQTRRLDLGAILQWLEEQQASTFILGRGEEGVEIGLTLPREAPSLSSSIEEVEAIRKLADTLAALYGKQYSLMESFARAQQAIQQADKSRSERARMEQEVITFKARNYQELQRLASLAAANAYTPATRLLLESLEQRLASCKPTLLLIPKGSDSLPLLARAHLQSGDPNRPFVITEGTMVREHQVERWLDPLFSPISLASEGTWVLRDGAALPGSVQKEIAILLGSKEKGYPSAFPVFCAPIFVFTHGGIFSSVDLENYLELTLAQWIQEHAEEPLWLPRLFDRPEDVRALLFDGLAREGLRQKGFSIGIEPAALAVLLEYPFPGEDAELMDMIVQLVAVSLGDVVRVSDLSILPKQRGSS